MSESLGRVTCNSCSAPCCRKGASIELISAAEADFMRRGGTVLTETSPPAAESKRRIKLLPLITKTTPAQSGQYVLESDCGYLTTDPQTGAQLCSAYDMPERPSACRDFKAGDFGCMIMQFRTGKIELSDFHEYLLDTAGCSSVIAPLSTRQHTTIFE